MISSPSVQRILPARVHRLSRVLAGVCILLAVIFPIAVLYSLLTSPPEIFFRNLGLAERIPRAALMSVALWQHVTMVLLGLVPVTCVSVGLVYAGRCFARFARGMYFTAETVRDLRGFAVGVFASGVASLAVFPILHVVMTTGEGAGGIAVAFNVSSNQLLSILFGGIVWQIAAVMAQATDIAQEHAQFV
jgi:uncharacterized membrane protein YagU involved in acid resistance